jgi:hypothetical protein
MGLKKLSGYHQRVFLGVKLATNDRATPYARAALSEPPVQRAIIAIYINAIELYFGTVRNLRTAEEKISIY